MKKSIKCLLAAGWFTFLSGGFASATLLSQDMLSKVINIFTAIIFMIPMVLSIVEYKLNSLEEKHAINESQKNWKRTTMKCVDHKTCLDFDDADNLCPDECLAKRCS
jgi:hypothetical protein